MLHTKMRLYPYMSTDSSTLNPYRLDPLVNSYRCIGFRCKLQTPSQGVFDSIITNTIETPGHREQGGFTDPWRNLPFFVELYHTNRIRKIIKSRSVQILHPDTVIVQRREDGEGRRRGEQMKGRIVNERWSIWVMVFAWF